MDNFFLFIVLLFVKIIFDYSFIGRLKFKVYFGLDKLSFMKFFKGGEDLFVYCVLVIIGKWKGVGIDVNVFFIIIGKI